MTAHASSPATALTDATPHAPEATRDRHVLLIGGMRHLHAVLCDLPGVRTTLLSPTVKPVDATRHARVLEVPAGERMREQAAAVHAGDPVDHVISFEDRSMPMAAQICEDLGVSGHEVATADAVTDKHLMRSRLAAAGVDDVASTLVHSPTDVKAAADRFGYPVILKPVDGYASTAIARIDSAQQIPAAWARAREETSSVLLVEQFIHGPEMTVEAVSVNGEHRIVAVTEKVKDDRTYIEISNEARATGPQDAAVIDLVTRALTALGVQCGPSHTEVILSESGPRVVETHLRPGGDFIPEMVEDVTGIPFLHVSVRALLGDPVLGDIDEKLSRPTGRRAAFWARNSDTAGVLREIVYPPAPATTPVSFHNLLSVGADVRPPESCLDRVVLARAVTEADGDPVAVARAAAESIQLVVEPAAVPTDPADSMQRPAQDRLKLAMPPHTHPGRLIAMGGLKGVGKSTLARGLIRALAERGITAVIVKPHTPAFHTYPLFTDYLASAALGQTGPVDVTAMTLVSLGDMLQKVRREAEPLLAAGTWVILDRYVMDQVAGVTMHPYSEDELGAIRQVAQILPAPDHAFLVHLDSDVAARRTQLRDHLDDNYDHAFLRAAADRFAEFAHANGWTVLDGGADPATLVAQALQVLAPDAERGGSTAPQMPTAAAAR